MSDKTRWLLPNGIDELLPEQARRVEHCRRRLLDICAGWGYEYVVPPLVEFSDSLLVGLGADLDELTCKFADRETGKTLAVRADITPQVARIDAHSLGPMRRLRKTPSSPRASTPCGKRLLGSPEGDDWRWPRPSGRGSGLEIGDSKCIARNGKGAPLRLGWYALA